MKKLLIKIIPLCVLAAFAATTTLTLEAQDKPAAAAEGKKDRPQPFVGKINAIDTAAKTINIGKERKRTIHIDEKTKIRKAGKEATLADAAVGDEVAGSYRETDGKMIAGSLRIGPKPEGEAKDKAEKKKKE